MRETPPSPGLFASVRQLLATALEMAQVRLALFSTELEQEKLRIFQALLLAGAGMWLLAMGTVLVCGFVLMLFWDSYRLAAVGLLAVLFVGGGALALYAASRRLRNPGGPFQATLAELGQDRDGLAAGE